MADNTIFSGSSRYASDFQQIIERSMAIAGLPKRQLEQQQATLALQSIAMSSLQSKISSLRSALNGINSSLAGGAYSMVSSDTSVAKGTLKTAAVPGSYTVDVVSLGAKTSNISLAALTEVSDPAEQNITSETELVLTANGASHTITLETDVSLSDLAAAINATSAAGVQATVVNVAAPSDTPDYRLSLQSRKYNSQPISLTSNTGTVALLDAGSIGSPVTYRLNGYPAEPALPLESDSRTLNIAPGTSVELLKVGTAALTVARSTNAVGKAIENFVSAFNAVVSEVDRNRGENKGALQGNSVLATVADVIRRMMSYSQSDTDAISNPTDIGLEFSDTGQLSFSEEKINAMSASDLEHLISFLGSSTGGGLLKYGADVLKSLDDASNGLLTSASESLTEEISNQDDRIATQQVLLDQMEEGLIQRMSAADAMIASLEQQVLYFTGMFEAMRESSRNF